ncbi:substrate-binding domain-containing protein [Aminiphilus circumscriptus]|uniref:substrate-binding domain-containing protein n=1 Tax=Aminiphilus circumscriptus TaxID=290732 RepID=UPI000684209B|nr:substrate-binding domain-containing protein [Aminiphilus circumscriptus]
MKPGSEEPRHEKSRQREYVSLAEATEILYDEVFPHLRRRVVKTPCRNALGRILAEDVLARRNVPHYQASAVDGYALSAARTKGASASAPVEIDDTSCLWVNTGNPVPEEFDSVLMVEDASFLPDGSFRVYKSLSLGANIRPVGEDVMRGQIIGKRGERVTPMSAALFLAAGVLDLPLSEPPVVTMIPTGDEIETPEKMEDMPVPGRVAETNSTMIAGFLHEWGVPCMICPIVADDRVRLEEAVLDAVKRSDIVLVGAGTAKGKRDHAEAVLASLGKILFKGLRMKPGRPAILGMVQDTPVLCLPGFPMSSAVVAWSVLYPLVRWFLFGLLPEGDLLREALRAVPESMKLLMPHSSPQGIAEWLRVKGVELDGVRYAVPLPSGSSVMWAMAEADGFALLHPEQFELPKGTSVNVFLVKDISWKTRILFQGSNDPALEHLLPLLRDRGGDMVIRSVGSLGGLTALRRGEGHVGACHLLDPETGEYNTPFIQRLQEGVWKRVLIYWRMQGILVPRGNPKGIFSVADFSRETVRIANRQPGAGTRVLLDALLKEKGVAPENVQGYGVVCTTHLDAASRVASGSADAALGIKAAADAFDLDFLPLTEEPYELIIPEKHLSHLGIEILFACLQDSAWKYRVELLGGYRWPA